MKRGDEGGLNGIHFILIGEVHPEETAVQVDRYSLVLVPRVMIFQLIHSKYLNVDARYSILFVMSLHKHQARRNEAKM